MTDMVYENVYFKMSQINVVSKEQHFFQKQKILDINFLKALSGIVKDKEVINPFTKENQEILSIGIRSANRHV